MKRLRAYEIAVAFIILVSWTAINLVPISIMILSGFKSTAEIFTKPLSLPAVWRVRQYLVAWREANFAIYFVNSIFISLTSIISITLLSAMAAYILSSFTFPGKRILYMYMIAGLVLPIRLAIIPMFLIIRSVGLVDTLFGLFIIYSASGLSFSVFILYSFFKSLPRELHDAACIDGAGFFRIFWQIDLPLLRPALATVAIVNFVYVWNDFFFPLIFIYSKLKKTIPLGVQVFFGEFNTDWQMLFSILTIAIIPVIILFLILRKQFISGLTKGAIR